MNLEAFELQTIEVEKFQLKEVIRCQISIMHTIFFHRALRSVKPKECECDVFDISYVRCDDAGVLQAVEQSAERFSQLLERNGMDTGRICLSFYKRTYEKSFLGFNKETKVFWERWSIPFSVQEIKEKTVQDRSRRQSIRQQIVKEELHRIIKIVNNKMDHIPPVPKRRPQTSTAPLVAVFPFEITFSAGDKMDESWGIFKRLLKEGPPLLNGT